MENKIKLLNDSINAIWVKDKNGVLSLTNKYTNKSVNDSNYNEIITDLISTNEDFTRGFLQLLKDNSYSNLNGFGDAQGGGNAGQIIQSALQGIGMITSTWKQTASLKAQAQVESAQIGVSKKLSQGQVMLIVFGGIVLLGATTYFVIKSTK